MVKASGPGRRNPMIKIRELVSTVGSLRYEEVDGVRKEKERLTTDHQSYLHITLLITVRVGHHIISWILSNYLSSLQFWIYLLLSYL